MPANWSACIEAAAFKRLLSSPGRAGYHSRNASRQAAAYQFKKIEARRHAGSSDDTAMFEQRIIDQIPLTVVALSTLVMVMISMGAGTWMARAHRKRRSDLSDGPIGSVVGATLGLLAFMLAFTFGIAMSRRDTKRDLLLTEVNSIGTTWLRIDLMPESHQADLRRLLKRYVDIRVEVAGNPALLERAIQETEEIQDQLWAHVKAVANAELPNPDITALFVQSLNETIDLQTTRIVVGFYRIPTVIWVVLAILASLSMVGVGYQFGLAGKGNFLVNLLLGVSFSAVIMLIADLDRYSSGWLKVSNEPMVKLQAKMQHE